MKKLYFVVGLGWIAGSAPLFGGLERAYDLQNNLPKVYDFDGYSTTSEYAISEVDSEENLSVMEAVTENQLFTPVVPKRNFFKKIIYKIKNIIVQCFYEEAEKMIVQGFFNLLSHPVQSMSHVSSVETAVTSGKNFLIHAGKRNALCWGKKV